MNKEIFLPESYPGKIEIGKMGFSIARIIAIGLLVWALDKHSYGYYKLLRFIVCAVSI